MKVAKIYSDGACSKNPGPAGYAAVLLDADGNVAQEHSGSVIDGTNNIAELLGIRSGLAYFNVKSAVKKFGLECDYIAVYTDSSYCIGVLDGTFRIKKNPELIAEIRALILELPVPVRFVKVKGHSGDEFNERADVLAKAAVPRE